ncbi:hypothetical protein [Fusobacterium gonidiaformans]|uniref:hypothetical protein n=1 Tax=Fusobacterium gonidiaformans TaxID=849 RepID=UPI00307D1B50
MYRFLNHLIYTIGETILGFIFILGIIFIWVSIQEGIKNKSSKKIEKSKVEVIEKEIENPNINKAKKLQDEKINSYCTFNFFEKLDKTFENISKIYPDSLLVEWQNNKTEYVKSIDIDKKNFDSKTSAVKRLNFYIINFQNGIKEFITDIKEFDFIKGQLQKTIYIFDEDMDILYGVTFFIDEDDTFYSLKIQVKEIEELN